LAFNRFGITGVREVFIMTGLFSFLGAGLLFRNIAVDSAFSLSSMFAGGITLAGAVVITAVGLALAGLLALFSRNGRNMVVMIISAVLYLIPGVINLLLGYAPMDVWTAVCFLAAALYTIWICFMKYER